MTDQITLTMRGKAKMKETITDQTTTDGVSMSGGMAFTEKNVKYEVDVEDSEHFHRLMCKRSAAEIAKKCLPDAYNVERKLYDDWDVTANINAVEATEWAKEVARSSEDSSVFDVLTLWLQTLGSMRIRRALHSELQEEGVDMIHVG